MSINKCEVNVTKYNFVEQSNDFMLRLPNASFVAIDEEMTGISLPPTQASPLSKEESPSRRYSTLKLVPERYSIIQLGVSLFEQTPAASETGFIEKRYKFTMFPSADQSLTREITLHPSAIHFLNENNMSFDTWVNHGTPFCCEFNARKVVEQFLEKYENRMKLPPAVSPNLRKRLVLTKEADKQFHARCITRLREWLDTPLVAPAPSHGEGVSLLLPRCSSYLRRSLYEAIQRDYPYLVLETENEQIRVLRMTDEERATRNKRLLHEDYVRFITEAVGVYRIFLALSKACRGEPITDRFEKAILAPNATAAVAKFVAGPPFSPRKIPLVVHNGLMDLLFLLTHFHSSALPESWVECKDRIHSYFPVIYDTKVLACEYCIEHKNGTHLKGVYEETLQNYPEWRRKDESEDLEEQLHDAAYDAYMTGVSFCGLSRTIHDHCKIPLSSSNARFDLWEVPDCLEFPRWLYGRNKVHFHLSPYTIDLETPSDPLGKGMSETSTYRVSNIRSEVTTRDILDCVRGLTDSRCRAVNIELFWVDNTTFLVGIQIITALQPDEERFKEHGKILLRALEERFCNGEDIKIFVPSRNAETAKTIWNLWGLLESDKRGGDRPKKRSRLI